MADFDFGGLLSNAFGGGGDSEIEKLLTAKQREQLGLQSGLSAAAALLQAGGRGPQRISLGQALGSALMAGQGAYERGTTGAINQMFLGQKIEDAKRLNEYQKALMGGAGAAPSPAMQAMAAPASEVGSGPSPQRAMLMDQLSLPKSADDKRFEELMRKADIANMYNRPEDADKYLGMAYKIKPQAEVVGQPFEVTDAAGKPLMVQQYKSGKLQTLEGYGPKRDVVLQNFGNRTVAIDKSRLKGNESFAMGMSPSEAANLSLRQQEFNRGAYDIKEGAAGFEYVPKVPGAATMPVMTGGGQQMTSAKEAPADFSKAAKKLSDLKGTLESYKTEVASDKVVFPAGIPLPFDTQMPLPTGADTARMRGKYQALLMGVKDLYDLGALTGPDMGIINQQLTNPASFAGVFTSRNAMKEQIGVLEDMLKRSEENLSSTYRREMPKSFTAGISPTPAAPQMIPGAPVWDPVKKQYVYQ